MVTLDLPGVGTERHRPSPWSVPAIVEDLRARLPRDGVPMGIYAQSLGGMIALEWVSRHPDDFAQVVVCNTSARDLSSLAHRLSWFGRRTMVEALVARTALAREQLTLKLVANSVAGRAHAEEFAAVAVAEPVGYSVLLRQLVAAARHRAPPRVPVPLLVLASESDRMVSPACSAAIAERYSAPLAIHPGGGHDLPLDDAEWVADQIVAFDPR